MERQRRVVVFLAMQTHLLLVFLVSSCTAIPTPRLHPAGGTFHTPAVVVVSLPEPSLLARYTTDGSIPTSASTPYTQPILLSELGNVMLTVAAFSPDGQVSDPAQALYSLELLLDFEVRAHKVSNGTALLSVPFRIGSPGDPPLVVTDPDAAVSLSINGSTVASLPLPTAFDGRDASEDQLPSGKLVSPSLSPGTHSVTVSVSGEHANLNHQFQLLVDDNFNVQQVAEDDATAGDGLAEKPSRSGRSSAHHDSLRSLLESLSPTQVAEWARSELDFDEAAANDIKRRKVQGTVLLAALVEALERTGRNASRYSCVEPPSLGLPSYCIYHRSICIDQDMQFVVIDDTQTPGAPIESYWTADRHPNNDLDIGAILIARKGSKGPVPFRSYADGYFMQSNYLNNPDITWIEPYTFLAPQINMCSNNIFHVASAALIGWHHVLHHDESAVNPFDWFTGTCTVFEQIVAMCNRSSFPPWGVEYLASAIGDPYCTPQLFNEDIQEMGKPVCFKKAFMPGHDAALFQGPEDAQKFRDRVWRMAGRYFTPGGIMLRVVYLRRQSSSRQIINEEALFKLIEEVSGIPPRIVEFEGMGLLEQAAEMANAAVLIATHGAGLSNSIFMPPGGVVIELSPALFASEMYHYVAVNSGHWYLRYTASANNTQFPERFLTHQDNWTDYSTRSCMDSYCMHLTKNSNFTVDIPTFNETLTHALDLICYEYPCGYEGAFPCNHGNKFSTCAHQHLRDSWKERDEHYAQLEREKLNSRG